MTAHHGAFVEGDAVDLLGPDGTIFAKGLARVAARDLADFDDVVVHRDDLVLFEGPTAAR